MATMTRAATTCASVLLPELQRDRRAREVESFSNAVLEVAREVVVRESGVIGEEGELRWRRAGLSRVLQSQLAPFLLTV